MFSESIWYYNGKFIELLGDDPYGHEWHHCSYAMFNETKLGLEPGTVENWCKDHGYRPAQLYNDFGDSWEEFFEFLFKKGFVRIFIANDRANIMYLSKNKKSVNACIDMLDEYGDTLKKKGVFYFILAAQDNLSEPYKAKGIVDALTYLVNI